MTEMRICRACNKEHPLSHHFIRQLGRLYPHPDCRRCRSRAASIRAGSIPKDRLDASTVTRALEGKRPRMSYKERAYVVALFTKAGMTVAWTAERLGLSTNTVVNHRRALRAVELGKAGTA